jgi:NAD(P)-dependent dehydrogenase (short-subunit alcohol dehydrogenase family)
MRAVVTGAASGIGRAAALCLARQARIRADTPRPFLVDIAADQIRLGMSLIDPHALPSSHRLQRAFNNVDQQIHTFCREQQLDA